MAVDAGLQPDHSCNKLNVLKRDSLDQWQVKEWIKREVQILDKDEMHLIKETK